MPLTAFDAYVAAQPPKRQQELNKAFKKTYPVQIKTLPAGMKLWKLTDRTPHAGDTRISPWWAPYEQYEWAPGKGELLSVARATGSSLMEIVRIYQAVCEDWNGLNTILVVTLNQVTEAYFGITAGQARLNGGKSKRSAAEGSSGNPALVGSAGQFFIPDLKPGDISVLSTKMAM